jgi:hypothetical protein
LASQLSLPAQSEAVVVRGFDEDHVGILSSPRVMQQFNLALDTFGRAPGAGESGHAAGLEYPRISGTRFQRKA